MMDDLDELRTMARAPQHYSNYTLAGALHQVLDRLEASQVREAGLRDALERLQQYAQHKAHCDPIIQDGECVCGLSAAPPREA